MANSFSNQLANTRKAGSGFTIFVFGGVPIAFAQQVSHQAPRFVNQPSPIQPMDEPYPVEILIPVAAGVGTLVLNLYDLWANNANVVAKVWDRLGNNGNSDGTPGANGNTGSSLPGTSGVTGENFGSLGGGGIFGHASDIVDIAIAQAQASSSQMSIVQYVRQMPNVGQGLGANSSPTLVGGNAGYIQYHGNTIVDVRDDETVAIGTLEVVKQITVNYTYATRGGVGNDTNWALALRAGA